MISYEEALEIAAEAAFTLLTLHLRYERAWQNVVWNHDPELYAKLADAIDLWEREGEGELSHKQLSEYWGARAQAAARFAKNCIILAEHERTATDGGAT